MIDVYITIEGPDDDEDCIGCFRLPAVPRVGETIFVSFRRMLDNQSIYTEDAIAAAKAKDGTTWRVVRLAWEASFGGDGRVDVFVEAAQ